MLRQIVNRAALACAMLLAVVSQSGANGTNKAPTSLVPQLGFFEPLVGNSFSGSGLEGTQTSGQTDNSVWRPILGGRAVQHIHSLSEIDYGGRTIYFYDPRAEQIRYVYVSTQGFMTTGAGSVENGRLVVEADLTGNSDTQRVRGVLRLTDDGYELTSKYLQDDQWVTGHGFIYQRNPTVTVELEPSVR